MNVQILCFKKDDDDDDDLKAGMAANLNACNTCKQLFIDISMRIKCPSYVGAHDVLELWLYLVPSPSQKYFGIKYIDFVNSQLYLRHNSD